MHYSILYGTVLDIAKALWTSLLTSCAIVLVVYGHVLCDLYDPANVHQWSITLQCRKQIFLLAWQLYCKVLSTNVSNITIHWLKLFIRNYAKWRKRCILSMKCILCSKNEKKGDNSLSIQTMAHAGIVRWENQGSLGKEAMRFQLSISLSERLTVRLRIGPIMIC